MDPNALAPRLVVAAQQSCAGLPLAREWFIAPTLLLVLTAALLFPTPGAAATITVYTDRDPALLQESFQLTFEATGSVDGDPDFSPLEQDFQVLSTSTSTSMSIVNTQITSTKQWRLALMPLRAGELIIPAISFGKDQSPQATLTVTPARGGASGRDTIFLNVQVEPQVIHVQQQAIYTVKLYRALSTSNETLSEPALDQGRAIVELLDADRSYNTFIQGQPYSVFERSYGIYPQVSGDLLIPPVRFQAQLSSGAHFSLDPFGAGASTVVRQSEPVQLQVKPVPVAYQGQYWLPATDVKISETWSTDPNGLVSNEPVTRSLVLTAQGLTASQLPELPELFPAGFKQYPDKPALDNGNSADGITGTRQQKNAIIPAQAGAYTLPEVSLPWWNTQTQSLEYAVLPERRIQVTAGAAPASATGLEAPVLPAPTGAAPGAQQAAPLMGEVGAPASSASSGMALWQWLTGLLAVAWLSTLGYLLKTRRSLPGQTPPAPPARLGEARKKLARACRDNDPEQVKTALLQWATARPQGPPITSLGDLAQHSNEQLATELRNLSRCLYARSAEPWRGEPLWQAFLQEEQASAVAATPAHGELEPLYRL
ncbi:MAG: BatD family protein [Gammaproteobacteria bacterium]|nr:BatD family protein [Gammaproteobacteria bacterium]